MNQGLYQDKIRLLRQEGDFNQQVISAFSTWAARATDSEVYRINPVQLADQLQVDSRQLLDFFVHGARVGIFDFSWSMICPSCGEIQNNDHGLNDITGDFYCVVCQAPVKVNIDDTVEVTFAFNPAIRALHLDPFANSEAYRQAFFSPVVDRSPEMLAYMSSIWEGFEAIPAGETLIIARSWERGQAYRMVSAGVHSQLLFQISDDAAEEPLSYLVDFGQKGMEPAQLTVDSLNPRLVIKNLRPEPIGLMIVQADFPTLHRLMKEHPSRHQPFLTGNQLLSNQKFRELYKIQNLSAGLKLNIRSLTLLFTDLKGSTELYDQTGDIDAYTLIQEHFELLGRIVARHSGAVIKTMGDAVMASFSRPSDAVQAAAAMLEENQHLKSGDRPLGLKIGLHEGPALAINNQGQLDYFGQTVNIAARVQGLAGENSLWMTEQVLKAVEVGRWLKDRQYRPRRFLAALKGVGERTTVYEWKKEALAEVTFAGVSQNSQ